MKLMKLIAAGAIIAGLSMTSAIADYNKGVKYYNKFVKNKSGLKSLDLIKKLNIKTAAQLDKLLDNKAAGLIAALTKAGDAKSAAGIAKIAKSKKKLKDLRDFLIGIMNGKLPAGCS
jgi:hypothetical protein